MRRTLGLLAVLGLVATACGGGGTVDVGAVPDRPSTTTTAEPAEGGGAPTTAPEATTNVTVWFVRSEALEPVTRTVPRVPRIGAEAVKALVAGPTAAEAGNGFTTAVPRQTRFLDLVIDANGIAKVDLSRDFESGGGSLGLTLRLAQVTCTVTQFPTVKGVRFALAGELVNVFSGNGIVLDKPVTCDSYREVMAQPGGTPQLVGLWPLTTRADVEAYAAGSDRTYTDPVATARAFAVRYLGMADPVDFGYRSTGPGGGEVGMGPRYAEGRTPLRNPQQTFSVMVRATGVEGGRTTFWTVTGATSPNIVVTSPREGETVRSPVRLTGQAHAFEGTVNVQVREYGMLAGQSLGTGVVTGGGDMLRPYSGTVTFRAPTKPGGAIVYTEISAADGQGILRAAVLWVAF